MRKGKGFTLIELLVVISIIGILTTLVAANLNNARERARDANRKSDLRNIQTALRLYYNDVGAYPAGTGNIVACGITPSACTWGDKWDDGNGKVYMNTLPGDPLSDQEYTYTYKDDEDYDLSACLENASDDKCVEDFISCPTSGCKYTVIP